MFNTTSTLILVLLFLIIVYLLFRQRWYVRILLLLVVVGGLTSIALGLDRLLDEGKENDIAGALLVGFGLLGVVLSVKETERKQREGN
ncbi:MAG: hypothetical protein KatS3mg105_3371 [Gemmatales bacterium]|nr:MAG: hypothetical protein KatS3mg105_3371 [Gemmatales bacterium]